MTRFVAILIVLVTVSGVLFLATPWVFQQAFSAWARRSGYDHAGATVLSANPFLGRVVLADVRLTADGDPALTVAELDLDLAMLDLLRGAMRLESVRGDNASVSVRGSSDGQMTVAGLRLPESTTPDDGLAIDLLHFSDSVLDVSLPDLETQLHVDQVRLVDARRVLAGTVTVRDLKLRISRNGSASWRIATTSQARDTAGRDATPSDTPDSGKRVRRYGSLSYRVERIAIEGDSVVDYEDRIFGVAVRERIRIREGHLTGLDSDEPEQPVGFVLREQSDSGAGSSWRGRIFPFKSPVDIAVQGELNAATQSVVAAIAEKALRIEIEHGTLASKVDFAATAGKLAGTLTLDVGDLRLRDTASNELAVGEAEIGLSLPALLRGEMHFGLVRLNHARLSARQSVDGTTRLDGISTSFGSPKSSSTAAMRVDRLQISDSEIHLAAPRLSLAVHVDELEVREGRRIVVDTVSLRDLDLRIVRESADTWTVNAGGHNADTRIGLGRGAYDRSAQPAARLLPDLSLTIGKIDATGMIRFEGHYGDGIFRNRYRIEKAELTDIDNRTPDTRARVALGLRSADHGEIALEGSWYPFRPGAELTLHSTFSALELPVLSHITEPSLGFRIDSGQMDGDVEARVSAGEIDGHIALRINLPAVTRTDPKKLRLLEKNLHDTLNLRQIVGVLTDDNGVMAIDVPVSGNATAPEFGLSLDMDSAVRRAVSNVVGIGLSVLAPMITVPLRELTSNRPRLAPVVFAPMSYDLDDDARADLDKTAAILVKQPALMVTLCGKATDHDVRHSALSDREGTRPLPMLAENRADAVKTYLVERHGAEARRLIACLPRVEPGRRVYRAQDDQRRLAPPRVEIR